MFAPEWLKNVVIDLVIISRSESRAGMKKLLLLVARSKALARACMGSKVSGVEGGVASVRLAKEVEKEALCLTAIDHQKISAGRAL